MLQRSFKVIRLMIFLGLLVFYTTGFAFYTCDQIEDLGSVEARTTCDSDGKILKIEKTFKSTGTLSVVDSYKNEKLILRQSFNTDQNLVQEHGFEYPDSDTFFKLTYKTNLLPRVEVARVLFKGSPVTGSTVKLAEWVYDKQDDGTLELRAVDHFKDKLIVKRDILKASQIVETYVYEHPKDPSVFKHVDGFVAFDTYGNTIKKYRTDQSIDVRDYVSFQDELNILLNQNRRRIVVFDTGFDVSHPDLAYKFYLNINDEIDGLDNDGNGIVDDLVGWHISDQGLFSNNINERISVKSMTKPYIPFSHGTHVASVALEGVEDFALTAFSGNMSDVEHLDKISDMIFNSGVEYVNMSFSLGDYKDPMAPAKASFNRLEALIRKNDQTVFVVAAGNAGQDLDKPSFGRREFPASYRYKNIVSVGALDSSKIEEYRMPYDKPIFFSAFGKRSVDIFSPGHKIKGAAVGGGLVEVSGTSMAAPYTLNIMLKIASTYPGLTSAQIREAVLYSAYIPDIDKPFSCSSGGMLFPRRAFEVARLLFETELSVKDAALQVRSDESFLLPGESVDKSYLEQVEALWTDRNL